jgi:DNA repair protein RecO (recombination protein O)
VRLETQAIICAVRAHGEHGAIVRALTPGDGMQPGYVRGGRSRRLRPVLLPGNLIQAEYRARTDEQLAQLSVELVRSRAPLLAEALPAAAIEWLTALTAATLPEGQAYPRLYDALDGILAAVEAAPSARGWAAALVRYELLILRELGFGLDRGRWPAFLREDRPAEWPDIFEGLAITREALGRDLLVGRQAGALDARERLVERLRRVTR